MQEVWCRKRLEDLPLVQEDKVVVNVGMSKGQ